MRLCELTNNIIIRKRISGEAVRMNCSGRNALFCEVGRMSVYVTYCMSNFCMSSRIVAI